MNELPRRKHVVEAAANIKAAPENTQEHLQKVRVDESPDETQLDRMNRLRPEQYALTAVVIDRVMEDFLESISKYPPYGLRKWAGTGYEAVDEQTLQNSDLEKSIEFSMGRQIEETVEAMAESEVDNPIIVRLAEVMKELSTTKASIEPATNTAIVEKRIKTGLNTFISISVSTLLTIKNRLREKEGDVSNERIAQVARNSVNFILKASRVNIAQVRGLDLSLNLEPERKGTTETHLVGDGENLELDYVGPVVEAGRGYDVLTPEEIKEKLKTLGCPAGFDISDEENVIKRLWQWMVNLAEAKNFDF